MKKLLMSLAIVSTALTAAAPAAAQWGRDRYYDDRGYRDDRGFQGRAIEPQLHQLNRQISRNIENGRLTYGEANRLRAEVRQLWRLASRFASTGGYDRREQFELQRRVDWVRDQLRYERRDNDRRFYRY
jgi:hypothetical protein